MSKFAEKEISVRVLQGADGEVKVLMLNGYPIVGSLGSSANGVTHDQVFTTTGHHLQEAMRNDG